jgi:hypothetical protein
MVPSKLGPVGQQLYYFKVPLWTKERAVQQLRCRGMPRNKSTAEQLRADIDHGRTGDKVDWPDPAGAPLGTDEEAAGTPTSGAELHKARMRETSGPSTQRTRVPSAALLFIGLVALLGAASVVVIWIQN